MDKKIVEKLEKAINLRKESLQKDKKALEVEIEKLKGTSEIGENGKFKKTLEQEKYEIELEKVVTELEIPESQAKELQELIEKEKKAQEGIEKNKLSLSSLNKDKEALEEEIANMKGSLEVGENGKLKKTNLQEKYEKDLSKVLAEIDEKQNNSKTFETELQDIENRFKSLSEKYQIKDEKELEPENNMWEEYRKEQEKQEEKIKQEVDQAYAEKEAYEKAQEATSPDAILSHKQASQMETKQTIKPNIPIRNSVKNNPKYTIKNVNFTIENNQPVYYATLEDEAGNIVNTKDLDIAKFENITILSDEQVQDLEEKGIVGAKKFYDPNIVHLLTLIDEQYGTSGVNQYRTMLKEKELKEGRKSIEPLDIDYDFSELYQKPENEEDKNTIKKLKKIAKNNYIYGLATYEREPNIFKKLWRMIKQKSLPKQTEQTVIETKENDNTFYQEGEKEAITPATILRDYEQMHDEPGFDIEVFVEGMSEPEADKYRKLQEEYQKADSKDAYKSFRDKLKTETESVKVQSELSENVQKIMEEEKEH